MGIHEIGDVLLDRPVSYAMGASGEAVITAFLRSNGFRITRTDRKSRDVADIEAEYGSYRVLVEVKAAEFPDAPPQFSQEEEHELLGRAQQSHRLALEARVQLRGSLTTPELSIRYVH